MTTAPAPGTHLSAHAQDTLVSSIVDDESTCKARLVLSLRQGGVFNMAVLKAMNDVPRDMFVARPFERRAFEDTALPIGCGQTISQPLVVALMTQALDLNDRHKVLEIGTGSGYQSAILARLARRVYSIERHAPLLVEACARFKALEIRNIVAREGDGHKGWGEQAPFDRIMVTAAAPDIPRQLVQHLSIGGVMVLPIGQRPQDQHVVRVRRFITHIQTETLFPVRFVPMVKGMPLRAENFKPEIQPIIP